MCVLASIDGTMLPLTFRSSLSCVYWFFPFLLYMLSGIGSSFCLLSHLPYMGIDFSPVFFFFRMYQFSCICSVVVKRLNFCLLNKISSLLLQDVLLLHRDIAETQVYELLYSYFIPHHQLMKLKQEIILGERFIRSIQNGDFDSYYFAYVYTRAKVSDSYRKT